MEPVGCIQARPKEGSLFSNREFLCHPESIYCCRKGQLIIIKSHFCRRPGRALRWRGYGPAVPFQPQWRPGWSAGGARQRGGCQCGPGCLSMSPLSQTVTVVDSGRDMAGQAGGRGPGGPRLTSFKFLLCVFLELCQTFWFLLD